MDDFNKNDFLIHFTYDTNKIEGSKLSFEDVENIIKNDKYPIDATNEDINECIGLYSTMLELFQKPNLKITPTLIKKIHYMIFSESKIFAGVFRSKPNERVAIFDNFGNLINRTTPPEKVRSEIKNLCDKHSLKTHDDIYEPFRFHILFEKIHPFLDGNGRVGRVLLNYMLIKQYRPLINIRYEDRLTYYGFLTTTLQDGTKAFANFYNEHRWI